MTAEAWAAQLDLFERDLESPTPTAWTPDPGLGPLPAHLVERARSIAARQLLRTAQLRSELSAMRDELAMVRAQSDAARLIPGRRDDTAAYLDRAG